MEKKFASLYFTDPKILKELEKEADKQDRSFNHLVVDVLTQLVAGFRTKTKKTLVIKFRP